MWFVTSELRRYQPSHEVSEKQLDGFLIFPYGHGIWNKHFILERNDEQSNDGVDGGPAGLRKFAQHDH